MKRFLVLAIAIVVLAAWSVPATAAVDFGGQLRVRGEWRDNVLFQDNYNGGTYDDRDQAYINQRVRLTGVAHPTDDTTVKITIQDTREWGVNGTRVPNGGPWLTDENNTNCISRSSDDSDDDDLGGNENALRNVTNDEHCNGLDMHESWVKIDDLFGFDGLSIKVGRQEMNFGDQRLIGAFGWNEYGRSFDAVRVDYGSDQVDVTLFASKIADQTAGFLNSGDSNDRDQDFYGLYTTVKVIPNNSLDIYVLWLRDASQNQFIGNNTGTLITAAIPGDGAANTCAGWLGFCYIDKTQNLYTFGARLKGQVAGIDYTFELPVQTGSIDMGDRGVPPGVSPSVDYDISAWAFAAKFGYTLPIPQKIRLGLDYAIASGDDDAMDSDLETFNNLFPTNHGHYGHIDQQGWRNMESMGINLTWQALSNLKLYAAMWSFKLAEEEDGWYGAGHWNNSVQGLGLRRAMTTNGDKDLGHEIDLAATYKYNSAVTVKAGVSRFFTDDYIERRWDGNDDDQDWGYLQLTANF
ncbi:MAG: alginate export family protein [Thermodesulfobacteriota bacterium]